MNDPELLIRDKYDGDARLVTETDRKRLTSGEPLAYVIGWIPFLGLRIYLDSHPLIPRPETEWWTELLVAHLTERFGDQPFTFLDMCAGSGAIGLSVLKACPSAHVTFSELEATHLETIQKSIQGNGLNESRATLIQGDLFASLPGATFDCIAINPPYIPSGRELPGSVALYEPANALFSGGDGLDLIHTFSNEVKQYLKPGAEVWLEADVENIHEAETLLSAGGALRTDIRTDLYGRKRIVVAFW
ncbi:MAG: HemK/PrmC family methyltransferase [Patescibacteria group bacterium]